MNCMRFLIFVYLFIGYEVTGLENLPKEGGALIIYYHGALPIDIYYLVSRSVVTTGRLIICVGDKFLQKIPGKFCFVGLLLQFLYIFPEQ